MRNNLMDTVAQAVNSLVSALQLPDESAKANGNPPEKPVHE